MSSAVESYWGTDFPIVDDPPQVVLLKQQAEKLTEITGGRVEGVVKESAEEGTAFASLYAWVPSMGDYQFKILYIAYPVVSAKHEPTPVKVQDFMSREPRYLTDTESFDRYLRDFLSSEEVRTAIGNLIRFGSGRAAS